MFTSLVDIHAVFCENSTQLPNHVYDILMAYGDAGLAVIRHHAVGEVYGIFDIAVGQVFSDFLCRHNCAVFLGFRCGCAQMRGYDDVRRVRPSRSSEGKSVM